MNRHVLHTESQYWVICMNNSIVAFYDNPIHMDLITYLHTDFTTETVMFVMNGLHLGKISSVEFIREDNENSSYSNNVIWNKVNKDMWTEKLPYHYNSIRIIFDFWHRTQTTYAFQAELSCNGFIDIPMHDGVYWTFYSQKPSLDAVNPNVWVKEKKINPYKV